MPDMIKDGTGKGYLAKVNATNRLEVTSESQSIQHTVSLEKGQAYQIIGTATLASGTVTGLHIKNTSTTRDVVITYIRHQIVDQSGGTAFPNTSNYFRIALDRIYSSGGSICTPINVNSGSGNSAQVICYGSGPTLTGTAREIDRWYTKSEADMNSFNKEGALIIPPNRTLELSYVGDQTSGTLYTRASFIMKEVD